MKAIFAVFMLALVAACGPRQVKVESGPAPTAEVAVHFTNNDNQSVNVYVISGSGTKTFIGQVGAGSTQHLPVVGVASGAVVTLQAARADGTKTYTKEG